MKITRRGMDGKIHEWALRSLIESALEDNCEGQVETAQANATSALEAIGILMEILHLKGVLITSDVKEVLGGYWPCDFEVQE
jgi:hypothetical protein